MPIAHTKPDDRPQQSNDPSAGPTRRYRKSPYPMLSVDEALLLISENTPQSQSIKVPVKESLVGYVLAEDVKASEAVPAFRASIVDGYAIKIPKSGRFEKGTYPVSMISHAQAVDLQPLEEGKIARITTGAPLPPGADAVIMVEDTILQSMTEGGKEEKEVEILTSEIKAGENVREVGSDVEAGTVILKKGEGISAVGGEFGLLASVGSKEVSVYKKPVIGILSTGDEIVPHDREGGLKLGEVRDTNRPTLITAVRGSGFEAVDLGIVSDKYADSNSIHLFTNSKNTDMNNQQTRRPRIHPPHLPPKNRHPNNHRRRLNGRTRPPKTHHRTFPRRQNSLRPRLHETRKTNNLRHRPHKIPHNRHPHRSSRFLTPWEPRFRRCHIHAICVTEFTSVGWC